MTPRESVDTAVRGQLNYYAEKLEDLLDADVMAIDSPIMYGLDQRVRVAIEGFGKTKRKNLAVVLNTDGGVVEVVERIVNTIRTFYEEVDFLIPDRAMSAGTILAMSGDRIHMDYFSCLGPIDPQVPKNDGRLVPALSYLIQYGRLIDRANNGQLTSAELVLLNKLDLAELHRYEQARELSISLLKKWLTNYKFKDWKKTATSKKDVTEEMREERAKEIATALSNNERWYSHARGIGIQTLRDELNLKIEDLGSENSGTKNNIRPIIRQYHAILRDYIGRHGLPGLVHTREFF